MALSRVLVVDDDSQIRKTLSIILERDDCDVSSAASGEEALDVMGQEYFDLVLVDVGMPGISGQEVLKEIKRKSPSTIAVMMAEHGAAENAIQALKLGADDFLKKPFDADRLMDVVRKALEHAKILKAVGESPCPATQFMEEMAGDSRLVRELKKIIERVAGERKPVLITGEPGAGKKMIARLIHQSGKRSGGPLLVVNCAQDAALLQEGRAPGQAGEAAGETPDNQNDFLNQAHDGTVVLEEIGELSLEIQSRVLNLLGPGQDFGIGAFDASPVDVRVIALTGQNLRKLIEDGKFLKDLYSGLSAIPIYVPPLREHIEDLPMLINHFLAKLRKPGARKPNAASPEYIEILGKYDFPGNVCELENIVSHSLSLSTRMIMTPETLPAQLASRSEINALARQSTDQGLNLKQAKALATERTETKLIRRVLNESQGNFSMAARKLGISRSALYYKIKKYKIDTTQ